MIALLSWVAPAFSADGCVKYLVYYFLATVVYFLLSVYLQKSSMLQWLGGISYPVFLLHEPLVGRLVSVFLLRCKMNEVVFVLCWTTVVLAVSYILMQVVAYLKVDRILWNFQIPNKEM